MASKKQYYDPWMRRTRRRGRKSGRGISIWVKLGLALGLVGIMVFTGVVVAGFIVYNSYADDLVAPDELAINEASGGAKIFDRNGKLLYEYVDDRAGLRRPVAIENIAPEFLAATIATEDNSFFTNPGVNINGLLRAAWSNSPFGGGTFEGSGGSSITQQLVKNVYIPPEARSERWSKEGIERKLKETIYAIELTDRYSKEQVLEWYVNQISYGGVYNGVEAAAQGYFGKSAKDLTLAEAAMLAGIPQSPAEYDPVNHPEAAKARRNEILDLMVRASPVQIGENTFYSPTPAEIAAAKAEDINISEKRFPIRAPHFVLQYVQPLLEQLLGGDDKLYRGGLIVTTSLDIDMQDEFQRIMEEKITAVDPASGQTYENLSNSHNGSMMYIDPKTGEIRVMLGSRDYWNEDIEGKNNNATACNSPGSSFKPFAYITTFYDLGWGPGTILLDTPVEYEDPAGGPPFIPKDPIASTNAPMTIRNALGNSMNIPANKAAAAVGADKVEEMAKKFGFAQTFEPYWEYENGCGTGGYGPAIATGGVGVTLEEMMIGYSVMANSGVMRGVEPIVPHAPDERQVDPIAILKIEDEQGNVLYDANDHRKEEQVIDPEYTYLIWDILVDPNAECLVFGCGGTTIYDYPAGVKTGTSEPFNEGDRCAGLIGETWGFAYSPDVVVGIWAGNSDNDCVEHLYSTSISYRAAKDGFLAAYDEIDTVTPMQRPDGVVEAEVCVPSGLLPSPLCGRTTKDLFVKDRLPEKEDDWWRRVTIDRRTGMIATATTPSQYRKTELALVPPEEWLQTDEDKKAAEEWAKELGIVLVGDGVGVGTTEDGADGNEYAAILLPREGQKVAGVVQVLGRATSPDFQGYLLEWGIGEDPENWVSIVNNPNEVQTGTIGAWNTAGLPDNKYTLRLTVLDGELGEIHSEVTVVIGDPPDDSNN
jgi:membrane peptidoglycan carboxypeptidase